EQLEYLKQQYEQGNMNEEQQQRLYEQLKTQLDVNSQIIEKLDEEGRNTSDLVEINKTYAQFTYDIYQNMLNQGYAQDEVLKALGLTESEIKSIYDYTKNNVATINIDGNTSDLRKELNDTL